MKWYHILGILALVVVMVVCSIMGTLVYVFGLPAHYPGAAMATTEATATISEAAAATQVLPTPTLTPTLESSLSNTEVATRTSRQLTEELFQSPVQTTDTFNKESAWLIAEPGVILDDTTAWTIPGTNGTWYVNVPEGAFTYFSLGQGTITVDGYSLNLPYKEGHNYLVLVRGRIDDAIVDSDRNMTAEVTDFKPGHAIWSWMPKGAYVSKNWFHDQMVASTTEGYTNCGALGCSHLTIVLFDVDTHLEQRFAVSANNLNDWKLINQ